jgi:DNA-binding winged helix-turn-helix (wHTH) protein/Tol biopolymer transport system component
MAVPDAASVRRIRFGLYEVDLVERQLRRGETIIKLQDRPFEVLAILVERPGEVITREEFRRRLWPADTFVDFDASLNTSVNKLRQALSDSADNPRFIATAGRRGYRFIAPATAADLDVALPQAPLPSENASPPDRDARRRFRVYAALGAAGVAFASIVIVVDARRPDPAPKVSNLVQITHDGLLDPWGKLTTDGARLFYLDRSGSHWTLMQVPASGGDAQPFPEPSQNLRVVDIAPDRADLLTFAFLGRSNDLPLSLTPVVGGPPRRVGNIIADDAVFSPDGRRIIFDRPDGIYSSERDGSGVKKLVALPHRSEYPQWSKDGRRLRFTLDGPGVNDFSIWEVSADGSNLHEVNLNLPEPGAACCGRWSADGRYFFFTYTRDGLHSVWAVRDGSRRWLSRPAQPVQLTFGPDNYGGAIPSEEPNRVFVWSGNEQFEVARYYPASGRVQPLLPGVDQGNLSLSPDGLWLCFAIDGELWRSRADGSERQSLVSGLSSISEVQWSPDSTRVLFHALDSAKSERFFVTPAEGGPSTQLSLGSGHNEADWGPDGKTIVFAKWMTEGEVTQAQSGIFLLDLRTSQIVKVPDSEGLIHPISSPDGRFLAAVTNFDLHPDQPTRAMLYDTRLQKWREIARGRLLNPVRWSKDSRSLYYQDMLAEGLPAFRFSIAVNKPEPFADFETLLHAGYVRCQLLGFAPDGSLVVALRRNQVNVYRLDLDLP